MRRARTPALPKRGEIDIAADRIGLPCADQYIAFDYWANAPLPAFKDRLKTTLPPQSCRILAVRPLLDRPMLISTSRHITQGIVDVAEETWDAPAKSLRGKSRVVGGDRYELRIVAPSQPRSWKATSASVSAADQADGVQIKLVPPGECIRATISLTKGREVEWSVAFK